MSKYTVTIGEKVWQASGATYIAVALGIIAILAAAMIGLIHIGGMWLLVGRAQLVAHVGQEHALGAAGGLGNRAREFSFVFFPATKHKLGGGWYTDYLYTRVEELMDKFILAAATEQGIEVSMTEEA